MDSALVRSSLSVNISVTMETRPRDEGAADPLGEPARDEVPRSAASPAVAEARAKTTSRA
jgi:hypothetical protein